MVPPAVAVDGRLPRSVETTAYFAIAEALTNVALYAQARTVRVTVRQLDRVEVATTRPATTPEFARPVEGDSGG